MLNEICLELKNWFDRGLPKQYGKFTIENGKISDETFTTIIREGQYFRVWGSVFNDGVYQYSNELNLHDETFDGSIWLMAVPQDVIKLAADIEAWVNKYEEAINSPYQSESFGGYSYSKTSNAAESGGAISWQHQFASKLNKWRKI